MDGWRALRFHTAILLAALTGCAASRPAAPQVLPVAHETLAATRSDDIETQEPVARAPRSVAQAPGVGRKPLRERSGHAVVQTAAADEETPVVPPASAVAEDAADAEVEPAAMPAAGMAWNLASLESMALQYNPAIAEASASARKAQGFRNQVGRKPNPTVGYNGSQLADQGTDQHVGFVEQQIVLGDKLSRNQAVLDQDVQSQLWEVEAQRFRVLTDVRMRFYEALAAQRRLDVIAEFQTIAEKGVELARIRRQAEQAAAPELLQAEIQLNEALVQQRRAAAEYASAWNQLMAVVGAGGVPPARLEGELPLSADARDWEMFAAEIIATSPEVQAARARVSRARANLDRQEAQPIPNPTVMLGAGQDNGTNSGMLNLQVGLPVPLFNKNQGNIEAACAELTRASQEVRRIEQSIKARVAKASQNYDASRASLQLYQEEILPRAQQTLDLAEQAYEAGEFSFLQVLIVRRTYFDANLQYVMAQGELAQTQALINGLVLSGGLDQTPDTQFDSGLRDQALGGQ